jgi:hypothetical protein
MTDVARYRKLFVHRSDVYAEQQPNGAYFPVRRPITDDELEEHLGGMASYGTYVIRPEDNTVKFIVFDLDNFIALDYEHLLASVEGMVPDPRCLLVESSGRKGFHVWLFLAEPIPAARARAWVNAEFFPRWNNYGGSYNLEVFPKQDTVDEGGFGNLVKLPLGRHAVSGNWSEFIDPGSHSWPSSVEGVVPLDVSLIPEAPEPVPTPAGSAQRERSEGDGPSTPFPCIDQILYEGVGTGYRDNAMFHLALYLYGHGIPEDLAEDLCLRANENFDPPLSQREVKTKVHSAYRGRFASARCGTDWLRDICPGPCKGGWHVLNTQEGDLRTADVGDGVEVEIVRRVKDGHITRLTLGHPDAQNTPTMIVG